MTVPPARPVAIPRGAAAPPAPGSPGAPSARGRGAARPGVRWAGAVALLAAAFATDVVTGNEVSSSLYYVVVVAYATWFIGRVPGIAIAVLSALAWLAAYLLVGERFSHPAILFWNLSAEVLIYATMALVLGVLRDHLGRYRAVAARLAEANHLLDRETRAVGQLQRQLLPAAPPQLPGYTWGIHYETSTRAGGDYYDFVSLPEGRIGILIADASGHGAPAAVLMAMTRALLHTVVAGASTPAMALARLNCELGRLLPVGWFVTSCYAVLDPGTGSLACALAGHDPPFVLRAGDGRIECPSIRGGPLLGPFPEATYEFTDVRLEPGDALILYTDGLPEAADSAGRLLGRDSMRAALAAAPDGRPGTIRDHVLDHLRRHRSGAPASDDLTLVILGRDD